LKFIHKKKKIEILQVVELLIG